MSSELEYDINDLMKKMEEMAGQPATRCVREPGERNMYELSNEIRCKEESERNNLL